MTAGTISPTTKRRSENRSFASFVRQNRRALSALVVFAVMMAIFTLANPSVFLNPITYRAVFISLPINMFVVVPLVFIVTSGEIDLSFPATVGITSWLFSTLVHTGWDPFAALIPALLLGSFIGVVVGLLVTYAGLSSLVATLGMNFLMRGLVNIFTQGIAIQFPEMRSTALWQVFAGRIANFPIISDFPVHMLWAVLFVALGWVLFNRHKFGIQAQLVGDNPDSATEMGISVNRVKILAFVFMGISAALAGVVSVLVNLNWWPSTGDGLLLPVLAAVFVGGTPTWGGIGTVVGSSIGSGIISFIEIGIIGTGLTGFYTQFFEGLVIVVALIGHRFNGPRYR
jgi:ribose/xylose/arabinose/galactoside ABC-type transport system permease subunit